jgi:electron-transferring-flavoprotein dehydrogenase
LKEVWQVPAALCKPGFVQHTLGFPLQASATSDVYGGSFLYHMEPNFVLVGLVVGLDYKNPYLNPYKEFQRWKQHPDIAAHLRGGQCISYGARCLNEGGYHAVPRLHVPGGLLLGCSAGLLNSVKIKGSHLAMKSGSIAAETIFPLLTASGPEGTVAASSDPALLVSRQPALTAARFDERVFGSWIGEELRAVRNSHASFHSPLGTIGGMAYTALTSFVTKGREPWVFSNRVKDSDRTQPASSHREIAYPKPDQVLSFDLLTSVQRSGTNHSHDQPAHLRVRSDQAHVPEAVSLPVYAAPETRFCPAGVYEYSEQGKLVINAQNCVHCKCCSIKAPREYIKWTVPEGGGGPAYTLM